MGQVFADDFESGDTSAWDSTAGSPTVSGAAAMEGSYGCEFNASGEKVTDSFSAITTYRYRFLFDPNSFSISGSDAIRISEIKDSGTTIGRVELHHDGSNYEIRIRFKNDAGSYEDSGYYDVSDGATNCVEILYVCANNTGYASLWLEGVLQETISNVDTGTRDIDECSIGWPGDVSGTPSGTLYFDDFDSNDDGSEIGCGVDVAPIAMMHFRRLREQG